MQRDDIPFEHHVSIPRLCVASGVLPRAMLRCYDMAMLIVVSYTRVAPRHATPRRAITSCCCIDGGRRFEGLRCDAMRRRSDQRLDEFPRDHMIDRSFPSKNQGPASIAHAGSCGGVPCLEGSSAAEPDGCARFLSTWCWADSVPLNRQTTKPLWA